MNLICLGNVLQLICVSNINVSIFSNYLPDLPTLEFDNKFRDLIVLHAGTTLKIPVRVKGLPTPSVTWSCEEKKLKSGGNVNLNIEDKSTSLIIKKITRDNDGLYTLLAQNEAGEATAKFDVQVIGKIP